MLHEDHESNLCLPSHEVLLNELKYVHETIKDLKKEQAVDTAFRLRTEGMVNTLKVIGILSVVSALAAVYNAFN
jgi:hypothetical protein